MERAETLLAYKTHNRRPYTVRIDTAYYETLRVIAAVKTFAGYGKGPTIADLIDTALEEYFENHKDEIEFVRQRRKELHERNHVFD